MLKNILITVLSILLVLSIGVSYYIYDNTKLLEEYVSKGISEVGITNIVINEKDNELEVLTTNKSGLLLSKYNYKFENEKLTKQENTIYFLNKSKAKEYFKDKKSEGNVTIKNNAVSINLKVTENKTKEDIITSFKDFAEIFRSEIIE